MWVGVVVKICIFKQEPLMSTLYLFGYIGLYIIIHKHKLTDVITIMSSDVRLLKEK